jgi:hypothetical protein
MPHEKLQADAAKEVGANEYRDAMPYRQAKEIIETRFMTKLTKAPFDLKDATLVPKMGACTVCPFRTINMPDYVKGAADVCTNTVCYNEKVQVSWQRTVKAGSAKGEKPVPQKDQEKMFSYDNNVIASSGWIDVKEVLYEDPKRRTVDKLVGDDVEVHLAKDKEGKVHRVVRRAEAMASMRKEGHAFAQPKPKKSKDPKVEIDGTIKLKTRIAIIGEISERAGRRDLTSSAARLLARFAIESTYENDVKAVCHRRGLELDVKKKLKPGESAAQLALVGALEKMNAQEAVGLTLELMLTHLVAMHYEYERDELFLEAVRVYGVDPAAIKTKVGEKVRAEVAAREKAKASAKPAAKKVAKKK